MKSRWTMGLAMLVAGGAIVCGGVCETPPAAGQEPSAPMARSEQTQVALASGTVILGEMNSGLDSKKAKVGEKFTAHTTQVLKSEDGRTIMPRGTKLEGHVTQAEARNKGGTASTLGLQFDKAILKDGTEISLNVVVQAIAARSVGPIDPETRDSDAEMPRTSQTSPMGRSTPAPSTTPVGAADGVSGGGVGAAAPGLDVRSRGAVGMKGVTLDAGQAENRGVTVVSSNGKSVRLDDGLGVVLVVQEKKDAPAQ